MAEFSKNWKASKQPRKQRKYAYNAPIHTRQKFMTACVSKELEKKHGIKKISVRKGDKIKVLRGQFRGKTGKVNRIGLSKTRLYADGIERTKTDGSKAFYPVHPSNVIITEMVLDDKRRIKKAGKNEKQA